MKIYLKRNRVIKREKVVRERDRKRYRHNETKYMKKKRSSNTSQMEMAVNDIQKDRRKQEQKFNRLRLRAEYTIKGN